MKKKRLSNEDVILAYLKEHDGITSLEAFELFHITRLSAVIFNLKKAKYPIYSVDVHCTNTNGRGVCFSRYKLNKYKLKEMNEHE